MKIAVPVWEGRISPVLDTADRLMVFSIIGGIIDSRDEIFIGEKSLPEKARDIKHYSDILICGALSRPMESCLESFGVEVHGWVMGNAERLVEMYACGGVPGPEYYMPGCGNRQFYGCGHRHRHKKQHGGVKYNRNRGNR